MSNIALFNPSQVPAFAKNRGELSAVSKALSGGSGGGGKRISIKGMVFRLIAEGKEIASIEERYMDVVIVNAAPKVSRVFYAKAYDAAEVAGPDCWSADGVTPNIDSSDVQASNCAACSQNIAGSGNGNSRACRYQQRVAVVLANDMEGDVLQLALPATSIFGKEEGDKRPLQAYARWLAAQNIDPSEVITRMNFDTKAESPKLYFKAMRWLTDDEHPGVVEQGKSPDAVKAITMSVAKMDNVKAAAPIDLAGSRPKKAAPAPVVEEEEEEAPAPAPVAKAKPKAKPAPVVAEEAEEEVPEPAVTRKETAKPSAVPAKKASLAAMVGDWDDE